MPHRLHRPLHPKLLTTLRSGYGTADFVQDAMAGLSVAIVALPLSLAISIASGATPGAGLITILIGGLLISLLGGSRTQIGGPTAAFIVVVYNVIATQGFDGLVTATFMAGFILTVAGFLRLGSLVRFVPEPVIRGFTIGIAIVIAAGQVRDLLGMADVAVPAEMIGKIEALWAMRDTAGLVPALTGLVALLILIAGKRLFPRFPAILLAVGATALAVAYLGLPVDTIGSRFGTLNAELGWPKLPDLSPDRLVQLLPSAFVIAFLAGTESLLSAMIADRMSGGTHRPNTEVTAQGIANLGSALFAGLPATGAIARTAANIRAGGRTPVAGVMHVVFIALFLVLMGPLALALPLPALAAVLLFTAWNMAEPMRLKSELKSGRDDAILLILTLVLTVLTDLTIAVATGVALGLALQARKRHQNPPDWRPPQR